MKSEDSQFHGYPERKQQMLVQLKTEVKAIAALRKRGRWLRFTMVMFLIIGGMWVGRPFANNQGKISEDARDTLRVPELNRRERLITIDRERPSLKEFDFRIIHDEDLQKLLDEVHPESSLAFVNDQPRFLSFYMD